MTSHEEISYAVKLLLFKLEGRIPYNDLITQIGFHSFHMNTPQSMLYVGTHIHAPLAECPMKPYITYDFCFVFFNFQLAK